MQLSENNAHLPVNRIQVFPIRYGHGAKCFGLHDLLLGIASFYCLFKSVENVLFSAPQTIIDRSLTWVRNPAGNPCRGETPLEKRTSHLACCSEHLPSLLLWITLFLLHQTPSVQLQRGSFFVTHSAHLSVPSSAEELERLRKKKAWRVFLNWPEGTNNCA